MRSVLALAFTLVLALSGCLSGSNDGGANGDLPGPDLDGDGKADPIVHDGSGSVQAGGGTPVISFTNGAGGAEFTVPDNATLLFIELAWDSPAVALDLCIHAPADGDTQGVPNCGTVADGGGPGTPTNLVQATVSSPAAGSGWTATVYPDGPAANQAYQLKVTIFLGEGAVPEGYTALT